MQGSNDQIRSVQIRHWTILKRKFFSIAIMLILNPLGEKMQGSNDRNRRFWIRRPASPSTILIYGDAGRRTRFSTHINTEDTSEPCIFSLLKICFFLKI